jgi:hypothetical protein
MIRRSTAATACPAGPRRPVKNRRPVAGTIHKITYTNTEPELAFEARTTCHL